MMRADRVPAPAPGAAALFTFVDGREFRASDWPAGWINAEYLALKLKNVTDRNAIVERSKDPKCHKRSREELLQLQEDVLTIGHFVNQLGGHQPSASPLGNLQEALGEIGNLAGVMKKSESTPKRPANEDD